MKMHHIGLVLLGAIVGGGSGLNAQQSPYTGMTERPIKALSAAQTADLLAGSGMGYALAAELNRYPGPKHVIELRDSLGLSAEQLDAINAVYDSMQQQAESLGVQLIAAEAHLDSLFAQEQATMEGLHAAVRAAAHLEGALRLVHLGAHLKIRPLLNQHQRQQYEMLRGYGGDHDHIHRQGTR